jgi:Flp pilus assembly protein TadG
MRMRLSHWFSNKTAHRGQTLVLFALMSLTLIAGLGLVIDAGVNYGQRRNMQNAADTAALAGVRILSRQSTFPGTTRQMVWNAIYTTAVNNGVVNDPTIFQCVFINNDRVPVGVSCNTAVDGGGTLGIPTNASGVQVRVSETHTTFFMRAIGTTTSGTSASSRAQVRAMAFMPTRDVVFAVCGVQTATVNAGTTTTGPAVNILDSEQILDWTRLQPSPSASPYLKWQAKEDNTTILNSAYKFDWNVRDSSGNLSDMGGPTFQIYSPNIETCDAQGGTWRGAALQEKLIDIQMLPQGSAVRAPKVKLKYDMPDNSTLPDCSNSLPGPSPQPNPAPQYVCGNTLAHSVNGTLGCQAWTLPRQLPANSSPNLATLSNDGCVMFVPIVDNGGGTSPRQNMSDLRGRIWGVFYVFNVGGNYYGWAIKNYPVHEDGQNFWTPTYTGPITIALVKDD